jgi:glycosyltransferase involved in cell wall biosynthesis
MKILVLGTSFKSTYGGPARSIPKFSLELAKQHHDVGLWSPDSSATESKLILDHNNLLRLDGDLRRVITDFNPSVVHDNGLWLTHNHLAAKLCRQRKIIRVVSTRGMLLPWARNHKWLKKCIAWHLYQRHDLETCQAIHATSDDERNAISCLFKSPMTHVIPNGIDVPENIPIRKDRQKKTLLFVGRIYPVKGLPLLIRAFANSAPIDWQVRIVGPDEQGHAKDIANLIKQENLTGKVFIVGEKTGNLLEEEYEKADAFVLPSLTENFGMAIGEALARGLPVITTEGTPWRILKETNSGWWIPTDIAALSDAITELTRCTEQELSEIGARGRNLAITQYSWSKVAKEMLSLYDRLISMK